MQKWSKAYFQSSNPRNFPTSMLTESVDAKYQIFVAEWKSFEDSSVDRTSVFENSPAKDGKSIHHAWAK